MSPPAPPTRADWSVAGAVFLVALGARVLFLFTWPDHAWPHSLWYEGDAVYWAEWASALSRGERYEHGLPFRSPAVAWVLAALGMGGSEDFTWPKVLWCVVGAATCGMAYLVLACQFTRRAALVASALLAWSFALYVQSTSLNGETLYALLVVALVAGHAWLGQRPGWLGGATVGVLHGAAWLVRAEHPLLLLMLLGLTLWGWRGRSGHMGEWKARVALAIAVPGVAVLVCLPWSISGALAIHRYNTTAEVQPRYDREDLAWSEEARAFVESLPAFTRADTADYLSHLARAQDAEGMTGELARALLLREFGYIPEPLSRWVLVSSQGPLSFALANHPKATGGFSKAGLDDRFETDPPLRLALPSHLHLYNHGYGVGMGYILADPLRWVRLVGVKLSIFLEGAAQGLTAANWPLGRDGVRRSVDQFVATGGTIAWPWRALLGVLFAGGMVTALRGGRGAAWGCVILSKIIVTVLFYGYSRQGASILVAWAAFVGVGLDRALSVLEGRFPPARWIILMTGAAVAAASLTADVRWWASPSRPSINGMVREDPRWGGALLSHRDLTLRAEDRGRRPEAAP